MEMNIKSKINKLEKGLLLFGGLSIIGDVVGLDNYFSINNGNMALYGVILASFSVFYGLGREYERKLLEKEKINKEIIETSEGVYSKLVDILNENSIKNKINMEE